MFNTTYQKQNAVTNLNTISWDNKYPSIYIKINNFIISNADKEFY